MCYVLMYLYQMYIEQRTITATQMSVLMRDENIFNLLIAIIID